MISIVVKSKNEHVAEEHEGFTCGKECVDKIFVLMQLVENYREKEGAVCGVHGQ